MIEMKLRAASAALKLESGEIGRFSGYASIFELVDDQGKAVGGQAYTLVLPDGTPLHGTLDRDGRAYVGDIAVPGTCKVCFPEIDAKEWRTA